MSAVVTSVQPSFTNQLDPGTSIEHLSRDEDGSVKLPTWKQLKTKVTTREGWLGAYGLCTRKPCTEKRLTRRRNRLVADVHASIAMREKTKVDTISTVLCTRSAHAHRTCHAVWRAACISQSVSIFARLAVLTAAASARGTHRRSDHSKLTARLRQCNPESARCHLFDCIRTSSFPTCSTQT